MGRMPGDIMIASDGKIYGIAMEPANLNFIFSMNTDGSQFTNLKELPGSPVPINTAPLREGSDGLLYGTAYAGGANNAGIIFKINKNGSGFQVLHDFDVASNILVGRGPLLEVSPGVFYGGTNSGGPDGLGVIYKITSAGDYTVLKSFAATESMQNGFGFDQTGDS